MGIKISFSGLRRRPAGEQGPRHSTAHYLGTKNESRPWEQCQRGFFGFNVGLLQIEGAEVDIAHNRFIEVLVDARNETFLEE